MQRRSRTIRAAALTAALFVFGVGCQMFPSDFDEGPAHFPVDVGGLDYFQIVLAPGRTPESAKVVPVSLDLNGTGHLQYRAGRSPRVINSHWQAPGGKYWDDFRTDQIALTPEDTQQIFQQLVDAGAFESVRKRGEVSDKSPAYLVISIRIGKRSTIISTDRPAFFEIYDRLAKKF